MARFIVCLLSTLCSLWNSVHDRLQMFDQAKVLMATDLGLLRIVYVLK